MRLNDNVIPTQPASVSMNCSRCADSTPYTATKLDTRSGCVARRRKTDGKSLCAAALRFSSMHERNVEKAVASSSRRSSSSDDPDCGDNNSTA